MQRKHYTWHSLMAYRIANTEIHVRNTTEIESVEHLLLQRQRRWLGPHHYVLPPTCFLVAYYIANCFMDRDQSGQPTLRCSDHIKSVLRKCSILTSLNLVLILSV